MGVKNGFKVLIGGGSITGLTLANMLQHYDIDFVVLEAYADITPQVGASIGILPHGQRILDQLGLHQKILDLAPPLDSFHFRDATGKIIHEFRGMNKSMYERHGYPITFLDRQMVLKVLYDNIKDKTKILTRKRVDTVEIIGEGVSVKTSDGSSYTGDILVGADGIHSNVREEMWKIADAESPGWIPADERFAVPCDYGCVFGISHPCNGIEPGASNSVFKKHRSYILNGGPGGRVYWFYFFKLPCRTYGKNIPVYTKEDESKILEEIENDDITPNLKFREVIEKRISSVLVPLQEYVFRQWHYKRIITIGDASHKESITATLHFHPIAGHGGNACMESAAVLVNALNKAIKEADGNKPTIQQVERAFATTQQIRQARTNTLKEHSHEQQRSELLDTPMHEFTAFHLLPRTDLEDVTFFFSRNMPLAEKLDSPDLKPAPRLVPYKDELIRAPTPRGAKKWALIAFFLSVAAFVHYGMWIRSSSFGIGEHIGTVLQTGQFADDPRFTLKRKYTGIKIIDNYLVFLAIAYMPGLNNWDKNFGMIQMYFLLGIAQPIAIWTVEAYRKRNAMTPIAIITFWLALVQWAGIGVYMPIYYAIYTFISDTEPYWWPLNREVPLKSARSLLWANAVAYVLPTVLMFTPWKNASTVQNFETLWQVCPMLITLMSTVIGRIRRQHDMEVTPKTANRACPDVKHLKAIYAAMGTFGLISHAYCISKIVLSSDTSLTSVFWPDFSAGTKTLGEGLRNIFLADFWGFQISTYVWLCLAIWDLNRVGRADVHVAKTSAAIALSTLVLGPGATMSAVWYWREEALARTIFY